MTAEKRKRDIRAIWQAAVSAVSGEQAVSHAIDFDEAFRPDQIIAVGKAAVGSVSGCIASFSRLQGFSGYQV